MKLKLVIIYIGLCQFTPPHNGVKVVKTQRWPIRKATHIVQPSWSYNFTTYCIIAIALIYFAIEPHTSNEKTCVCVCVCVCVFGGGFPEGYDFRFQFQFFQNFRFPPIVTIGFCFRIGPNLLSHQCWTFSMKYTKILNKNKICDFSYWITDQI